MDEHDTLVSQANFNKIMAAGGEFLNGELYEKLAEIVESEAGTARKNYLLQELVEKAANFIAPHSACLEGCHHCCHMAVDLSEYEALKIGRYIGVSPNRPPSLLEMLGNREKYMRVDCPFLGPEKDGCRACTIYPVRPLACRAYFNISDNVSLCDLTAGLQSVPGVNFGAVWKVAMLISMDESYGDIRDFFPDGRDTVQSL